MLRAVLVLLLVANGLFLGWTRGWLGFAWPAPGESQREPERLNAQVRPERLVLLRPDAARAAASAPRAAPTSLASTAAAPASAASAAAVLATQCLEAGPFTADQLVAANQALARVGVDLATLAELPMPVAAPSWLVFAGRFADTAARRTRLQAWQRQGVPVPQLLDAPRELAPGLVFSRHPSQGDADSALAALKARYPAVAGLARVVQGPESAVRLSRLRMAAAPTAAAQRLREAVLPQQIRFTQCAAP